MIDLREEAPDSPASQALWAEYQALIAERLGPAFEPTPEIFAETEAFAARDAVWLVAYDAGGAVGCGGLRRLDDRTGEIKRMFVTRAARGRGHGRALLEALEARAVAAGIVRVRLLTTEVLREARALYAAAGYEEVERRAVGGRTDFWLERSLV